MKETKENKHSLWAMEMIRKYPDHMKDLNIGEIVDAWEDYSDYYCAGWLSDDEQSVEMVMDSIRKIKSDEMDTKQKIAYMILETWNDMKNKTIVLQSKDVLQKQAFKCVNDIYNMVKTNVLNKEIIPWRGNNG